jgi:hypothetical protein
MPTLTQPAIGSTAWGTAMNTNLQVLQNQLTNAMQGRIQWDSTTQVSLQRYIGDTVEVNGLNLSMGSSGIALKTSDDLINSDGSDNTGVSMVASTLYYVYLSNANASPFPTQLRASATKYVSVNGVRYLGSSGNAANWRFIGYVRTDGSTHFVDSDTQRFVVNYYNRRLARLFSCPGYVNDNLQTSYTTASTTWVAANGGTGAKLEYIANGEDAIDVCCSGFSIGVGTNVGVAVEEDSANNIPMEAETNTGVVSFTGQYTRTPAEGYRYEQLMIKTTSGTATYGADNTRQGASADPALTYITASVMI